MENDYSLFGSHILGGILVFIVDPVNEFTGIWLGSPAREISHRKSRDAYTKPVAFIPSFTPGYKGFSLVKYF